MHSDTITYTYAHMQRKLAHARICIYGWNCRAKAGSTRRSGTSALPPYDSVRKATSVPSARCEPISAQRPFRTSPSPESRARQRGPVRTGLHCASTSGTHGRPRLLHHSGFLCALEARQNGTLTAIMLLSTCANSHNPVCSQQPQRA